MDSNNFDSYKKIIDNRLLDIYKDGPILLKEPINYIIEGGKRIRPMLCMLTNEACGGKLEEVVSPAVSIELLHIFSLIHDDIMDDDILRHNKKTLHCKWNVPVGILSGDAILALALKELNMSSDLIRKKFNNTLIAVCEGQALDIEYESTDKVNLNNYLKMIDLKTAYMIGLSAELGAIVAGVKKDISFLFKKFGLLLGRAFQLQDDLLEITSTEKQMGKSLDSDIVLNKKTYLLLNAEDKYPQEIKAIYCENKNDISKLNKEIKKFLECSGVIDECIEYVGLTFDEINEHLNKLSLSKSKLSIFVNNMRNRKF